MESSYFFLFFFFLVIGLFLSLSLMTSKFIHVIACDKISIPLKAELYSIECTDRILLSQVPFKELTLQSAIPLVTFLLALSTQKGGRTEMAN